MPAEELAFRLGVAGAAGRMGRQLLAAVVERTGPASLGGVLVKPGHVWLGDDVGVAAALGGPLGVRVTDRVAAAFGGCHGILDFTAPRLSAEIAEFAAETGKLHVIGTTGFSEAELARIRAAAARAVIVLSGNMSLGVNLLTILAERAAAALAADVWDAEILEVHHGRKVDAPSGTALMLGEAVARGRGQRLADKAVRGRDGHAGPRCRGEIGFAALRGGDVVGEHDVMFAGSGERITLRHVATDRGIYARGAVAAALWARSKPAGLYGMADVLGLAAAD